MIRTCVWYAPPVFNVVVMQKFIILCIIRISNFTAGVMTRPVCFSLAGCCSRLHCRTTEQWFVYLIALAHPVRFLTRLHHRLVKFDPVAWPVMACMHTTGRSSRWCSMQLWRDSRANQSRRPSPRRSPHVMRFCLVNWSAGPRCKPLPLMHIGQSPSESGGRSAAVDALS